MPTWPPPSMKPGTMTASLSTMRRASYGIVIAAARRRGSCRLRPAPSRPRGRRRRTCGRASTVIATRSSRELHALRDAAARDHEHGTRAEISNGRRATRGGRRGGRSSSVPTSASTPRIFAAFSVMAASASFHPKSGPIARAAWYARLPRLGIGGGIERDGDARGLEQRRGVGIALARRRGSRAPAALVPIGRQRRDAEDDGGVDRLQLAWRASTPRCRPR